MVKEHLLNMGWLSHFYPEVGRHPALEAHRGHRIMQVPATLSIGFFNEAPMQQALLAVSPKWAIMPRTMQKHLPAGDRLNLRLEEMGEVEIFDEKTYRRYTPKSESSEAGATRKYDKESHATDLFGPRLTHLVDWQRPGIIFSLDVFDSSREFNALMHRSSRYFDRDHERNYATPEAELSEQEAWNLMGDFLDYTGRSALADRAFATVPNGIRPGDARRWLLSQAEDPNLLGDVALLQYSASKRSAVFPEAKDLGSLLEQLGKLPYPRRNVSRDKNPHQHMETILRALGREYAHAKLVEIDVSEFYRQKIPRKNKGSA